MDTIKIKYIITLYFVFTLMNTIGAKNKGFGLGIIIGEATRVSAKVFSGKNAFDAAAACYLTNNGKFHVHSDYLFHNFRKFFSSQKICAAY